MIGGELVREARKRAGITQEELAARAGTTQSAIARLESGRSSPRLEDVQRLMRLCGFDLVVSVVPRDDSDLGQAARLQRLSVQGRARAHAAVHRSAAALREAMDDARGG